jgi:hypothetical protein
METTKYDKVIKAMRDYRSHYHETYNFRGYSSYAQLGLYDAILFFILITIASGVLYIATLSFTTVPEAEIRGHHIEYAKDSLVIILESTIYNTNYTNDTGVVIEITNATVSYLILFDVWARHNGTIMSVEQLEADINTLLRNIIAWKYHYKLNVEYTAKEPHVSIVFSDMPTGYELPEERYTVTQRIKMIGELPGDVKLTLTLWSAED